LHSLLEDKEWRMDEEKYYELKYNEDNLEEDERIFA
jgi:hypothetical protein